MDSRMNINETSKDKGGISFQEYLQAIETKDYYRLSAIVHDPNTSGEIIEHAFFNQASLNWIRVSFLGAHPGLSLDAITIAIDNLIAEYNGKQGRPRVEQYPPILRNPNIPSVLLEKYLSEAKCIPKAHLAEAILLNPNCPETVMVKYLADKDPAIRSAIASNKNISLVNAEILAKDGHKKVRSAIARNKSIPVSLVETLKDDRAVQVLKAVAKRTKGEVKNTALRNLKLRADVIAKTGSHGTSTYEYIARNTDDVEVLEGFVMDSSPVLRAQAVKNPLATKSHKAIEGLLRPPARKSP